MTTTELCTSYLAGLNEGNLEKVLSLFSDGALVVSPLYGTLNAPQFFRDLFADTNRSVTAPLNIFEPVGGALSVALHFKYEWTLKSGKKVEFECVDVFDVAPDRDKFTKLTIIYDTAPLRADFNQSHAALLCPQNPVLQL